MTTHFFILWQRRDGSRFWAEYIHSPYRTKLSLFRFARRTIRIGWLNFQPIRIARQPDYTLRQTEDQS